jgi:hypothetical protein
MTIVSHSLSLFLLSALLRMCSEYVRLQAVRENSLSDSGDKASRAQMQTLMKTMKAQVRERERERERE